MSIWVFVAIRIIGRGMIKVISTSKIKKITAIKQKRREKGSREELLGSNPHSNADGFSRSWIFFLEIDEFKKIKIVDSPIEIATKIKIIKITAELINWKLIVLYYTIFIYFQYPHQ